MTAATLLNHCSKKGDPTREELEAWLRETVWPRIDEALEALGRLPPENRFPCVNLRRYKTSVRIAYDRVAVLDTRNLVLARAVEHHYGARASFYKLGRRLSVVIRRA